MIPPHMDPASLPPGASWVLLRNNGKMIIERDPFDVKFLFGSKSDMLSDIEHSLSHTFRCAGRMDWTVAQHSIFVSRLIAWRAPDMEWAPLEGLLHDAHEAYTGDIMSPVGAALEFESAKQVVQNRIEQFLDKDWVTTPEMRRLVGVCDRLAWQIESANLFFRNKRDPFLAAHASYLTEKEMPVLQKDIDTFWDIYDCPVQVSFTAEFNRLMARRR